MIENFKQVFLSSIPPSKINFRSKVSIPEQLSESSKRKGVDLSETYVDISTLLHIETMQRQVDSFLEPSSKRLDINLVVLDEIYDRESNWIIDDSSNEPGDNSTKTSTLVEKLKEEQDNL